MAIHDLSGFGRCSLTVALPILSAAGVNCCVLPTAFLSTHTGIEGFTYTDFTKEMKPTALHWKSIGLEFNAIYSGFLGSIEQIDILKEIFSMFDKTPLILVDPVMGDNGKLYKTFASEFPKKMLSLCKQADIITPNVTEATLLLGEEYKESYTNKELETIIKKLLDLIGTDKQIVLTGIRCKNEISTLAYAKDTFFYAKKQHVEGHYSGAGDIFASALLSMLLVGYDLEKSANIASHFTSTSIAQTLKNKENPRHGICFESELYMLTNGQDRELCSSPQNF